jgi:hypothetical protein
LGSKLRMAHTESQVMVVLGVVLLALAFSVVSYYAITVPIEKSFGERYVTTEIPLIFPFYVISSFKPITVITYLIFAGVVLLLEGGKNRMKMIETRWAKILLAFTAFASGYEVIWNFFAWFTLWQKTGGVLDLVSNTTHEYVSLPANFTFATKITFLVFALSLYGCFYLQNLDQRKLPERRA